MTTRRNFLRQSAAIATSTLVMPIYDFNSSKKDLELGVQLYTFRNELKNDAYGTLKQISELGFKKIETARSGNGHYYGFSPKEMKDICVDLGMKLVSGHVHLDKNWKKTMEEAVTSGQEYLICSTMPSTGQTIDNYKSVAETFNKAGEECKKLGLKFGYHNHEYEFEMNNGEVLYDILLKNTESDLVHMELDLGWVVVSGNDPLDYFNKYPGRFPLWHLKDMDMTKKISTEFGKGGLDIAQMMKNQKVSGVEHIFIEQEEYADHPFNSMKDNLTYLENM